MVEDNGLSFKCYKYVLLWDIHVDTWIWFSGWGSGWIVELGDRSRFMTDCNCYHMSE